jgi:Zn-dependent protease
VATAPPRLRPDLEITDPGKAVGHVVVFDPVRARYFRIRKPALAVLTGDGVDNTEGAARVWRRAHEADLVDGAAAGADRAPRRRSLALIELWATDPTPFMTRFRRVATAMTAAPALLAAGAVVVAGVFAVASRGAAGSGMATSAAVSLALVPALMLHELAHAAAVVRYGGRVRRIGVALVYLRPALYCDANAAWTFPRPRQRVVVAAAGIIMNVAIAGAAWAALWVAPTGAAGFLTAYGSANAVLAAFNLFPFVKLDGYWMLACALDRPNLRAAAIADAKRVLRGERPASVWSALFGVGCIGAPALLIGALALRLLRLV